MTLEECWRRLRAEDHGVLGTVHVERGVDLVPVVFAVVGETVVIPVDTVKPKSAGRLQRLRNLEGDSRCSLLVDQWSDQWEELWWVRAHGRGNEGPLSPAAAAALSERFDAYREPGAVTSVISLAVERLIGWSASS